MSTSLFRVCSLCLNGTRHFHKESQEIAVHRHNGGQGVGIVIDVISKTVDEDTQLIRHEVDIETITLAQFREIMPEGSGA